MVYLLDTTVLVDLIRTRSERIKAQLRARAGESLGVSIVTVCELQYGIERSARKARLSRVQPEQLLAELLAPLDVHPLGESVVAAYGRVRDALEEKGTPIGPLDTFIAAHALSLRATLVTTNVREFRRVPGLTVESWAE